MFVKSFVLAQMDLLHIDLMKDSRFDQ